MVSIGIKVGWWSQAKGILGARKFRIERLNSQPLWSRLRVDPRQARPCESQEASREKAPAPTQCIVPLRGYPMAVGNTRSGNLPRADKVGSQSIAWRVLMKTFASQCDKKRCDAVYEAETSRSRFSTPSDSQSLKASLITRAYVITLRFCTVQLGQ